MRFLLKQFLVLFGFFVGLSGCSSHYVVPAFEGDKRPDNEVGLLKVPEQIKVVSINGKSQDRFLLSNLNLDYQLLPGGNRIVFKYASLWAIAGGSAKDGKKSSVLVESNLREVAFNVKAGEHYSFDFAIANNRAEAEAIAKNFHASILDGKGQKVAVDSAYVDRKKAQQQAIKTLPVIEESKSQPLSVDSTSVPAPVIVTAPPMKQESRPKTDSSVVEKGLTNMDALKMFWERASVEDKKAFLKWAFKK